VHLEQHPAAQACVIKRLLDVEHGDLDDVGG
jgi:hypothetical protein